jgi:cellulose synthase/poly-beta-1,6-N-acetylglucosamine synthase-like glycosyltransferase
LIYFFSFLLIAHGSFCCWIVYQFLQIKTPAILTSFNQRVSVIIAVRNEASNILNLLADLEKQNYPKHLLQVIVVDDFSTDNTVELVKNFAASYDLQCIPSDVPPDKIAYKKRSVTIGIEYAKEADVIITTDGDCRVKPNWIAAIITQMETDGAHLVSSPVTYIEEPGWLQQYQKIDISGWIIAGAGTMKGGIPTFCNGANLAYRRATFYEVGGFVGKVAVASGDDEFMMHKIAAKYPGGVAFCKSAEALVTTTAQPDWQSFRNQRLRWASKWKLYADIKNVAMAIWAQVFYIGTGLALYAGWIWPEFYMQFLAVWLAAKVLPELIMLRVLYHQIQERWSWRAFFLYEGLVSFFLFYIIYKVDVGTQFEWKGRVVK